jgi:aminoglycoside phosphotransferase (APT) family kinase protein
MTDALLNQFDAYCRATFADLDAPVTTLTRLADGWETAVYGFDLARGGSIQPFVLRLYYGNQATHKAEREFDALQRLRRGHFPVPEPVHLESSAAPLGRPFILIERVSGAALWPLIFRDPELPRSQALLRHFCGLMARLHALDWRSLVDDPTQDDCSSDPYLYINRELAFVRSLAKGRGQGAYTPGMAWIEAHRFEAACRQGSIIHWDFHPGNVLLRPDDTMVVIDWTQGTISDARFDLAWTLVLLGSTEGERWRKIILREYEQALGSEVQSLDYFLAYACLRRLFSVTVSLDHGAEALGMRPGAEGMMRKHAAPLRRVLALFQGITGVPLPEIERRLAELG